MSQDLVPIVSLDSAVCASCPRTSHGQLHDPGLVRLHGPGSRALHVPALRFRSGRTVPCQLHDP
eukprot:4297607-Alexandrium_andersonii.AAC.1